MRPALGWALAVSLGASMWLALGQGDEPQAMVVAARRAPAAASRALPNTPPALVGEAQALTPGLPLRLADWPAPPAPALAAWQGRGQRAAALPVAAVTPLAAASAASERAAVFPYQWIGLLDDGGAPQVLLASAQRSVAVRRGAVLDGRWRLDLAADGRWTATTLATGEVLAVRGSPSGAMP